MSRVRSQFTESRHIASEQHPEAGTSAHDGPVTRSSSGSQSACSTNIIGGTEQILLYDYAGRPIPLDSELWPSASVQARERLCEVLEEIGSEQEFVGLSGRVDEHVI